MTADDQFVVCVIVHVSDDPVWIPVISVLAF